MINPTTIISKIRLSAERSMHFGASLLLLGFSLGITGCSQKAIEEEEPQTPGLVMEPGGYYITLEVNTPEQTATRSFTDDDEDDLYSSDGTLDGTTNENSLVSAHVYFCVDNKVIADFESEYVAPVKNGKSTIRIKIDDNIEDLEDLAGETVQIFIVGNTVTGSGTLYEPVFDATDEDDISLAKFTVSGVKDNVIGDFGTEGHLMPLVNAKPFEIDIPQAEGQSPLDAIKAMFSKDTPTIHWWELVDKDDVSSIDLERAVARIEYKDKRKESDASHNILKTNHNFQIGSLGVYLKLYSLTPFNVNKESYLFRHTSSGITTEAKGEPSLFGVEGSTPGYNWVASKDWVYSTDGFSFPTTGRGFWNKFSLNTERDAYVIGAPDASGGTDKGTILITDLDGRTTDADGYHPWCYVTENTLYSTDLMKASKEVTVNGDTYMEPVVANYATGVAFKFLVLDKDGEPLKYEETPGANSKYPDNITNSESEGSEGKSWITITNPNNGQWVDVKPESATFGGKTSNYYFLTYIACIVHNAADGYNISQDKYTPMFYGVVRNNTYRMSVIGIEDIPLPQDPRTMYIAVDVKVIPWTVRQNVYDF